MMIKKILTGEKGQGLTEYALILVLVAIVVMIILALLGPAIGNVFSNIVAAIENPGGSAAVQITGVNTSNLIPGGGPGSQVIVFVTINESGTYSVSCSGGTPNQDPISGSATIVVNGASSPGSITISGPGGSASANW